MKDQTFHEILKEKMKEVTPPSSPSTSASAKIHFEPQMPFFFIPKKRQPALELKVQAPPPPPENWIYKNKLDEDGQSKWNLFEKTTGLGLGEKISLPRLRSAFRKFLKSVHPDLTKEKSTLNFATLVKTKDELIEVLKKAA